ncbi:MAG: HlyC/CorC family transporter [Myxococcales bacterium]|nr:HlyC/CorC family transporter [Myxococcales bacterium]MCB9546062.1 HlyC/CorC family transporter [Myxococcales bacterium]
MSLLVVLVVATLLVSALCSLMEATLYSTRATTLDAARGDGRHVKAATRFLQMKENISAPTAAILILNTVANTAGATFAGMQATEVLGVGLLPLFSVFLTLGILFLSEILPKTLGATRWHGLWPWVATPLWATMQVMRPFVAITLHVSKVFTRRAPPVITTEDEILAMIRMGVESGEVSAQELTLLTNVFRFDETRARQIMVPRRDVVTLFPQWTLTHCLEIVRRHRHTRYPLCKESLDDVVGLIHVKDLTLIDPQGPVDLQTLAHRMLRVPETVLLPDLLRLMRRERSHMVLVVDEFGTAVGVVTLENVLEQLVGSVQDEFDTEEPNLIDEGDGRYLIQGLMPLAEIESRLEIEFEDDLEVDTLTGLIVHRLGRLPRIGDEVTLGDDMTAVVQAVHADRASRVLLSLRVSPIEPAGED